MKIKIKIAFIGCGNMARAMIGSMLNPVTAAALKRNGKIFRIIVADRDESKLMPFKGVCDVTLDNSAAVAASDYIILAVKPQDLSTCVQKLELKNKTVISIAAGVTLDELKRLTGADKLVRVMPNLCACVGESYSVFAMRGVVAPDEKQTVAEILGAFGKFREVEERMIDEATGITGCGPAYVFKLLKAFCDESAARGFSPDAAREMAIQTVIGSALVSEAVDDDFETLIARVCSKGGATAEGVKALDERAFESAVRAAVCAANEKARSFGASGNE